MLGDGEVAGVAAVVGDLAGEEFSYFFLVVHNCGVDYRLRGNGGLGVLWGTAVATGQLRDLFIVPL